MIIAKTIAIDGTAASGKSTLGRKLSDELDYLFLDTGVMYRAVTWIALKKGVNIIDEEKITSLTEMTTIDVRQPTKDDGRLCDILVNGEDITWEIRRPEVDDNVSRVSSYAGVRQALSAQQRVIGRRGEVVMVGRDIGTVVMPNADVKFFLDASVEERSHRRCLEMISRGEKADPDQILEAMQKRDEFDSNRKIAPLRPAKDAIIINTDKLNADQVFEKVFNLIQQN